MLLNLCRNTYGWLLSTSIRFRGARTATGPATTRSIGSEHVRMYAHSRAAAAPPFVAPFSAAVALKNAMVRTSMLWRSGAFGSGSSSSNAEWNLRHEDWSILLRRNQSERAQCDAREGGDVLLCPADCAGSTVPYFDGHGFAAHHRREVIKALLVGLMLQHCTATHHRRHTTPLRIPDTQGRTVGRLIQSTLM